MLLEFSLNYPDTAGSLWFYSKYEAVKFNKNIASNNNSKSLECEPRPIGNTSTDKANVILINVIFDVPLK